MSVAPVILTFSEAAALNSDMNSTIYFADNGARSDVDSPVRRPLRGIQLKPQTFARLSMDNGTLLDSSGRTPRGNEGVYESRRYANFILQSFGMEASEKFQQVLTFGLTYGFFFGQNPHVYTFQVVLADTADFPWVVDWLENYKYSLRGTQATIANAQVRMEVEEHTFTGYILDFALQKNADSPHQATLSFRMWVTQESHSRHAGDAKFPYDPATYTVSAVTTRPSTTQAVRNANIALVSQDPGKLRKLIAAVTNFINKVDQFVEGAEDFLYGRTIVKPDGPNITSQPVSQEVAQLINNTFGTFGDAIEFKVVEAPEYPTRRSYFHRNLDEYLVGGFLDQVDTLADKYGGLTYANGAPFDANAIVAEANMKWAQKTHAIANPEVASLNTPSLMEKIGKVLVTRAALLIAQTVLQGASSSATSSNVDGTMVAPTKVFNATDEVAIPLLGLAYLTVSSELGVSTLTDSILRKTAASQQPTEDERIAAIQAQADKNVAEEASRNTLSRTSRTAALQAKVDAARSAPEARAVREAARQAEMTEAMAETRRNEQADAAARANLRQQLLGSFA